MTKCKFSRAWIGQCSEDATDSGFCFVHSDIPCCICKEQATNDCYETVGPFVCGANLCDKEECKKAHRQQHDRGEDPGSVIMKVLGGGTE